MLAFYLNHQPFALDRGKSVRLNWRNPACNLNEFPGDVGLGIEIPVNEINRTLLGSPDRFERYASNNDREFEGFEIRYGGVLLMGGTLVIQTASHESYNGWLRSNVGNLGKEHREKYIFDNISFNREKTFENKADYDPLQDDYGCPRVYNIEFFAEKGEKTTINIKKLNPNYVGGFWSTITFWTDKDNDKYIYEPKEVEDLTWAFMRSAGWFVNAQNEDGTVKTPVSFSSGGAESIAEDLEVCVVSPMLFLNYILKTIFKDNSYTIENNFLADDPDLQKLILYNNYDITRISYLETQVTIIFKGWSDGLVEVYPRSVGYVVEDIQRDCQGTFLYKNLIPKIQLKNFLLSVQNLLNVFFFFKQGRKIVDIIDREAILTGDVINIEQYITGFWEMGEKKDSTLKFTFKHDDGDLMFTERWENIDEYRDKEKEPVETWDDLLDIEDPEMDEIRFLKSQNRYVQYKVWLREWDDPETGKQLQEKFLGWDHLSDGFQNGFFNYGKDEQEEIPTEFGTVTGENYATSYQKGNIRSEMFAYENFTPRLMFYLGNNEAKYETENISLDWEKEEKGLLATRWRNWAWFWATRQPVSCEAHFPLGMIDYVLRNIYKKFRSREGEFIIEEMETEFGLNQIGVTKIKGYKLNYSPRVYNLNDLWKLGDIIWIDQTIDFGGLERFYPLILDNFPY